MHLLTTAGTWSLTDHVEYAFVARRLLDHGGFTLAEPGVRSIAALPWLGLTLGLWLGMVAQLWIIGVRSWKTLFWLPTGTAASVYLLFVAVLDSGFPHGPVENLLAPLLGR